MAVSDPENEPYERIGTPLDARNLAVRVKDLRRDRPIVCVTIPRWGTTPLVDVDRHFHQHANATGARPRYSQPLSHGTGNSGARHR